MSAIKAAAIRFDGVGVRYGARTALDQVDFTVERGCIAALCGPNGAGKSSAMRIVCGLLRPSSGGGEVLGEMLAARHVRRRARIGYMAQHTVLYDELSVAENLAFRAAAMGLSSPRSQAQAALDAHGLGDVQRLRVGALSGGWRQRVAFCAAQLARPELMVLDEPTAGLDAAARTELWTRLRTLAGGGTTLLVSTHDAAEAAGCDTLIVLDAGRAVFHGAPTERWSAAELAALRTAAAVGMRPN